MSKTEDLYNDLLHANTEAAKKERFIQYLTAVFSGDSAAQEIISALTMGAERVVANISRAGRLGVGRVDSQTDTVIIEWEKDLTKTGDHARAQLEEYLEGNWRSGREYRFVLLATDGIRWRRYAPDWSEVEFGKFTLGRNFKLREVRSFDLSRDRVSEFPFFLDEVLFTSHPRTATLENIQTDFGDTSSVFINSMSCLRDCAGDIEQKSELQVAFEQWRRFLSVAYGRFDDSPAMFLVHTYLSVLAKFIAYVVVAKKPINGENSIRGILSGSAFERLNIERFVEDDFFHWVGNDDYFRRLRPMFHEINMELNRYDFSDVQEDILKGLYQELIDLETRHALGEYYTPDWLCERIVEELRITRTSSFLDPACGSGSFLRAAITRMKREFPDLGAEALVDQVVGIDIHPLSVLIAKTTLLLSLGDDLAKARRPVILQVYLANSLLVPRGTADLLEELFHIAVDNKNYGIDVKGISRSEDFDKLISFCDEMVRRYPASEPIDRDRFIKLLRATVPSGFSHSLPIQLYDIYRGMKLAHVGGRDSIWKFIIQNSYKPVFLMARFDFVVGNPPWLTYSSITNHEYQNLLKKLSDDYEVTPQSRANMPHLEIAAIFLAHAANYFLKAGGRLAFVLPRSFLSADHHDNTRSGMVEGVNLSAVWDLDEVSVLFRVPSCVLFATKTSAEETQRRIPTAGIAGYTFSGQIPRAHIHWDEAKRRLTAKSCRWFYSRLQGARKATRSALTTEAVAGLVGANAYEKKFTQGATIVPRNFFFVEIDQDIPTNDSLRDRVVALRTSLASDREAKKPWKGLQIAGRAEGRLLFRTAISRNIIPFALIDPPLVLLPVVGGDKAASFRVLSAEQLLETGLEYGSQWFLNAERLWDEKKTENNKKNKTTLAEYLNWQNKLTEQVPSARWLVLYTSSATDASAVVIDRKSFDLPFVVDHKAYWCECDTEDEAHYIAAYVNSDYANDKIKDFQSRGLFGPRDIHKLIVKLPFPRFQKSDPKHTDLSLLGKKCAKTALIFVKAIKEKDLHPRALGIARLRLKEQLSPELEKIDQLVGELSSGKSVAHQEGIRRRVRRQPNLGGLFESAE